ncbi:MAG: sucrase ferredoxin [Nitriliruptor sp.]|uniref:sucrase ferredoxin n=1 Tax=Nitriliruptor sp. TaxID=2448056 RepID=UPI0034A0A765
MREDSCVVRSKTCGEPLHGTASQARRWVLFEHPGAWGAHVLTDGTLPEHLAARLTAAAEELPARVLLLRRAPGVPREVPDHALFVGVTTPSGGWFERIDLHGRDGLVDVDLSPLAEERSVGGTPVTEPFYLVCTNGKHDACCAEYGRRVVDTLAPRLGDRLWESSHVGGDRFAGNLVCLPTGAFYGHLDPETALEVVRTHEAGEIDFDRWRGRSSVPFAVQSAEVFARQELDLRREDALRFVGGRRDGRRTEARFVRSDGGEVVVTVSTDRDATERRLTCAGVPNVAPVHRLVDLVEH